MHKIEMETSMSTRNFVYLVSIWPLLDLSQLNVWSVIRVQE